MTNAINRLHGISIKWSKGISILVEKSLSFGNLAKFPMLPLFSSGNRGEKHKLNTLMFFSEQPLYGNYLT